MLRIVIVMLSGITVGIIFRRRPIRFISKVITVLIWILLFFLGVEVGTDPRIIGSVKSLGLEALVLTVSGLAGSMAMAWVLWKIISREIRSYEE